MRFIAGFVFLSKNKSVIFYLRQIHLARAANFIVDNTGDTADALPGDGLCDDGGGNCTLRAAIEEANALNGPDIIAFNIPGGGPHIININTSLVFSPGLSARDDVWGTVIPELGSPGVISFKCPPSFIDDVLELQ